MSNPHAADVRLKRRIDDGSTDWSASIDGPFPVLDFALSKDEFGRAVLNVAIPVDSVQVGDKPADAPAHDLRPAVPPKNERAWGATPAKDPREGISGWLPEPAGSDTSTATGSQPGVEVRYSDNSAGTQRALLKTIRDHVRLDYRGDGPAGVTA